MALITSGAVGFSNVRLQASILFVPTAEIYWAEILSDIGSWSGLFFSVAWTSDGSPVTYTLVSFAAVIDGVTYDALPPPMQFVSEDGFGILSGYPDVAFSGHAAFEIRVSSPTALPITQNHTTTFYPYSPMPTR